MDGRSYGPIGGGLPQGDALVGHLEKMLDRLAKPWHWSDVGAVKTLGNQNAPVRPLLDSARVAPEALRTISAFHPEIVREVQRAVAETPVVVVGMAQNPHVKNVRRALQQAGIEFRYIEHGSYFSKWSERLAIKLWSGWPWFPQVFVRGTLIGGEDLTIAAIRDGSLARMLAERSTPGEAS